jgi:hypothetical protein
MKKYAEKFRLKDDINHNKYVNNIIHKISNDSLAKMKYKLSKFT